MKLPNGEYAIIPIAKLRDYCLNLDHPIGEHKARVFRAALGVGPENADEFRDRLAAAAKENEAAIGNPSPHGKLYIIDFEWKRLGKTAVIRSSWIIEKSETYPRLVTCYII